MELPYISTELIMLITAVIIGLLLAIISAALIRRGLFHLRTTGFWAIASFALYFFLTPLSIGIFGSSLDYELRLAISGGTGRGFWILLMAVVGIITYFAVYLRTKPVEKFWGISTQGYWFTPVMALTLSFFIIFGFYSLLTFRAGLLSPSSEVIIESGRFVGGISGYQSQGYLFLFSPTILLLLLPNRIARAFGWILAGSFVVLSLPHAWSRSATVSMVIAIIIAQLVVKRKGWPPLYWLATVLLLTLVLQVRGHTSWDLASSGSEIGTIVTQLPEAADQIFTGADTAMIATWYVESYLKDTLTGFDYGVPFVNYILTGWIPSRVFHAKYLLVDWLRRVQGTAYPPEIDRLLYGAKSSLLGSFYANGGMIALILEMAVMGYIFRKLDGFIQREAPYLLQAIGVAWMSVLWMVWGSSDRWGLITMGALSIPMLILVLMNYMVKRNSPYHADILNATGSSQLYR